MDFVTWSDKFSVKIPSIDEQHKKLVAVINELYNAMKTGKTTQNIIFHMKKNLWKKLVIRI